MQGNDTQAIQPAGLATNAKVPHRQEKHISMQQSIKHIETVCDALNDLASNLDGQDVAEQLKQDEPIASMAEVLNNGPEQIEAYIQRCNDAISRIREILF